MTRFDVVPGQRVREPSFYSVAEAAAVFGLAPVTVYRAIAAGDFPSVMRRGRVVVPGEVVREMSEAARLYGTLMGAANWAFDDSPETRSGVRHLD